MTILLWTKRLSVGVDKIDAQHKGLFDTINSLQHAVKESKGVEEVEKVMQFLSEYIVDHFATEEGFMEKFGYPGFKAHKQKHEEFISNFNELKAVIEKEGVGVYSTIKTNNLLSDWWVEHIKKVDMDLGAFLSIKIKEEC